MFLATRPDLVDAWYRKLDEFIGEVQSKIDQLGLEKYRLLILSDHGFQTFEHKVHLNRWLEAEAYLVRSNRSDPADLKNVDWEKTNAYALGLNSLYLNIASRERQGEV